MKIVARKISAAQVTETINSVISEWKSARKVSNVRQIGDGLCYDFVREVLEKLSLPYGEGKYERRTEDWWVDAEDFVFDIKKLKASGEPIPKDIPEIDFANVIGNATHEWIYYKGKNYDATAPLGEKHFLDMPFFKDQIEGLRKEVRKRK